jgi:hypothetical protein
MFTDELGIWLVFVGVSTGKFSDEQSKDMQEILSRYADVLTRRLEVTHLLENTIQLKDIRPVKLPP